MLRVTMPRLSGHSGQETQTYKGETVVAEERAHDPLKSLRHFWCRRSSAILNAGDGAVRCCGGRGRLANGGSAAGSGLCLRYIFAEERTPVPATEPAPAETARITC